MVSPSTREKKKQRLDWPNESRRTTTTTTTTATATTSSDNVATAQHSAPVESFLRKSIRGTTATTTATTQGRVAIAIKTSSPEKLGRKTRYAVERRTHGHRGRGVSFLAGRHFEWPRRPISWWR